jgi:omega-hydroxy-beta-dihydromenaquinone-9 sulfotransferase
MHKYPYWAPRFWHGMTLGTWLPLLARNHFAVSPNRLPIAASITATSVLNSFASVFDHLMFSYRSRATRLKEPPLFVLGHWRSGTTMLHEMLILDPRHTYPTTYQCFEPNHFLWTEWFVAPLTRWMLPPTRPMDNMATGWDKPQEDEFALCNLGVPSPYLAWAFPNHGPVGDEYLDLVSLPQADRERWKTSWRKFVLRVASICNRRVVLKSPTHTARVRTILEVFPDAKFIHIVRDPIVLFASTVRLWKSLSQAEGMQTPQGKEWDWIERHVFDTFVRMYERFEQDRELVPPGHLVDVHYEQLVANPVEVMQQIYSQLDLRDFASVKPAIAEYARQKSDYRPNKHAISPELAERIRHRWAPYFERYGYAAADGAGVLA